MVRFSSVVEAQGGRQDFSVKCVGILGAKLVSSLNPRSENNADLFFSRSGSMMDDEAKKHKASEYDFLLTVAMIACIGKGFVMINRNLS